MLSMHSTALVFFCFFGFGLGGFLPFISVSNVTLQPPLPPKNKKEKGKCLHEKVTVNSPSGK